MNVLDPRVEFHHTLRLQGARDGQSTFGACEGIW